MLSWIGAQRAYLVHDVVGALCARLAWLSDLLGTLRNGATLLCDHSGLVSATFRTFLGSLRLECMQFFLLRCAEFSISLGIPSSACVQSMPYGQLLVLRLLLFALDLLSCYSPLRSIFDVVYFARYGASVCSQDRILLHDKISLVGASFFILLRPHSFQLF